MFHLVDYISTSHQWTDGEGCLQRILLAERAHHFFFLISQPIIGDREVSKLCTPEKLLERLKCCCFGQACETFTSDREMFHSMLCLTIMLQAPFLLSKQGGLPSYPDALLLVFQVWTFIMSATFFLGAGLSDLCRLRFLHEVLCSNARLLLLTICNLCLSISCDPKEFVFKSVRERSIVALIREVSVTWMQFERLMVSCR